MDRCTFFHKWGRWSPVELDGTKVMQGRYCQRCMKAEVRQVWPALLLDEIDEGSLP